MVFNATNTSGYHSTINQKSRQRIPQHNLFLTKATKSDLKDYRVIARDSEGGVLVEKLKSSAEEPTSKGMAKAEMAEH